MPIAPMILIKQCVELKEKEERKKIRRNTRGIYVLYNKEGENYNVVYVGMARGEKTGIRSRVERHARSKSKGNYWTHFSIYEVHDNITEDEVKELEGLFRHIYRKDKVANKFNVQKRFDKIKNIKVIDNDLKNWNAKLLID